MVRMLHPGNAMDVFHVVSMLARKSMNISMEKLQKAVVLGPGTPSAQLCSAIRIQSAEFGTYDVIPFLLRFVRRTRSLGFSSPIPATCCSVAPNLLFGIWVEGFGHGNF